MPMAMAMRRNTGVANHAGKLPAALLPVKGYMVKDAVMAARMEPRERNSSEALRREKGEQPDGEASGTMASRAEGEEGE